jgi:hypothetical protein
LKQIVENEFFTLLKEIQFKWEHRIKKD